MGLQSDCGSNAQNGQAADVPSEWMTVAEIPPTKYTAAALLGGVVASAGLVIAQQVIKNTAAAKPPSGEAFVLFERPGYQLKHADGVTVGYFLIEQRHREALIVRFVCGSGNDLA